MHQAKPQAQGETFFFVTAILLLIINIAGFSLAAITIPDHRPPLGFWLILHAVTSFAWLLLLVTQTGLVRHHRIATHRRLGQWSGLVAAVLVISGVLVAIQAMQRTGNFSNAGFQVVSLVNFPVLIGLGLAFRKHSDQHKRFMLIATIAIMGPALSRLFISLGLPETLTGLAILAFLVTMIVYDFICLRHIKSATLIGTGLVVSGTAVAIWLNSSDGWQAFLARTLQSGIALTT